MRFIIPVGVILFCQLQSLSQPASKSYENDLEQWHKRRVAALKAEDGWLNLAGLFWLEPGINTMGHDSSNKVMLTAKNIPAQAGHLTLQNGLVKLFAAKNTNFTMAGKPVTEAVIYNPDSAKQPQVSIGSLRFNIIKRDNKLGVRLRNLNHPAIQQFKGVERFAPDSNYRVTAKLLPAGPYKTIPITNVLGQTIQMPSPGTLVFTLLGANYSFQCLKEDNQLFIIFGDETNADETYGAGRFLYAAFPDNNGNVLLDFNKAINPPCAFTPFATCPLPPKQNQLPIPIKVGEKTYGQH